MEEDTTKKETTFTGAVHGPVIAVLFIVLLLIFIGLVLWGRMLTEEQKKQPLDFPIVNNEPETPRAVADTQILETISSSDELSTIEADLESTNLDVGGADLTTLDAELEVQ